jgi:hypothetical protein
VSGVGVFWTSGVSVRAAASCGWMDDPAAVTVKIRNQLDTLTIPDS